MTNSFSTNLVKSSSQWWSLASGSQAGINISSATNFSIQQWVKFNSIGSLVYAVVENGTGGSGNYKFLAAPSGSLLLLNINNGSNEVTVSWAPSVGIWYHLVVTYNQSSGDTKFYVNGTQQGATQSLPTGGPNGSTGTFSIGREQQTSGGFMDGAVDDVRIWTRELSSTDISSLYATPCTASNGSNLVGWWKFESDSTDSSGNGNTLTNNNSATFITDVPYSCSKPDMFLCF